MSQPSSVKQIVRIVLAVGGVIALLHVLWLTVGVGATLQEAAATGNVDQLRWALTWGAGPAAINGTDRYGYGPLQVAAKGGHREALILLLDHGGNVNLRQGSSWNTPLQLAIKHKRLEITAFLREATAPQERHRREMDRKQFEAIHASVQEHNQLILEAFLHQGTRLVADSNGLHWETLGQGHKPGTYPGRRWNEPTYINGIAWHPRWSTGLYEDVLDRSEPCPVSIPSPQGLHFQMLGVGESRGAYVPKECPRMRVFRSTDGTFTVWFSGLEIEVRWCQFRLWWE